jgi:mannose-6-phosphate isomerase-like protein (cupin superfamily)
VKRFELSPRQIEHFGSHGFTHTRISGGEVHVSLVRLDGVIGGHEAASRQRLVVLEGQVTCSTESDSLSLAAGDAVEWQEGEWHETRSHVPTTLLLVEGALE